METGINKHSAKSPIVTFSRIKNNSELHYMRKTYISPTESYRLGLALASVPLYMWFDLKPAIDHSSFVSQISRSEQDKASDRQDTTGPKLQAYYNMSCMTTGSSWSRNCPSKTLCKVKGIFVIVIMNILLFTRYVVVVAVECPRSIVITQHNRECM